MSVPGDMSVAKSLADVLSRVAAASTRAGRAAPVRTRSRAGCLAPLPCAGCVYAACRVALGR